MIKTGTFLDGFAVRPKEGVQATTFTVPPTTKPGAEIEGGHGGHSAEGDGGQGGAVLIEGEMPAEVRTVQGGHGGSSVKGNGGNGGGVTFKGRDGRP